MAFRRLVLVLAVVAAFTSPQSLWAQSKGMYLSGTAGASQMLDSDINGTGVNITVGADPGYNLGIALGYAYDNNWRTELEMGYGQSGVDKVTGAANGGGDISALRSFFNGYYDFANKTPWTPYLGAGIGVASVDFSDVTPVGGSRIDDSDTVFAYQAGAGVGYSLSDRLGLFFDYRFLRTSDPGFRTNSGVSVDSEHREHNFIVGLRWSFGKPAPAPKAPVRKPLPHPARPTKVAPLAQAVPSTPAPTPAIQRVYIVFFDFNKFDLTDSARTKIAKAAANSSKIPVIRIEATGHADRSGPERYNMVLSQQRAQSVMAELIRLGLSRNEITILWKGEREPLVPTPDGVREAKNRRVEIILQK